MLADILSDLSVPDVLRRAGLLEAAEDEASQDELEQDTRLFLKLTIRATAQRAWSMMVWSDLPPNAWHGMLSDDPSKARESLNAMRDDQEVVDNALAIAHGAEAHPGKEAGLSAKHAPVLPSRPSPDSCEAVRDILDDLWVHRLVVVRVSWP